LHLSWRLLGDTNADKQSPENDKSFFHYQSSARCSRRACAP
jgi:hypothetical protein